MMFKLNGVASTTLPGVEAGLVSWPSLPGVEIDSVRAPGSDGRILADASLSHARFTFDVTVDGKTMQELFDRTARFAAFVDPKRGPGRLDPTGGGVWEFTEAVLAEELEWVSHGDFMRTTAVFETDPFARPVTDETWARTGVGPLTVKRSKGTLASFPTIEIVGALTAAQTLTVTVGTYKCVITGPVASGETVRLDFDRFEFARWKGTTKVASLVANMSSLDRLMLWPDQTYSVSVATTGTLSTVKILANARN